MSWVGLGQQRHDVTAAVRRLLGDEAAEVGDWATTELALGAANNPTSGAATRLRGTATTNGTDRAWSLVAKVVCPDPHDVQTPHSVIYGGARPMSPPAVCWSTAGAYALLGAWALSKHTPRLS